MRSHGTKLIAPIIISVLLAAYYIFLAIMIVRIGELMPPWVKILGVLIPLALFAVVLYVMIQRIQEIRSGEEDDLSQY